MTARGMNLMVRWFSSFSIRVLCIWISHNITQQATKFQNEEFGTCPRALCYDTPVLPMGLNDEPFKSGAKVFCPRCKDAFKPPKEGLSQLDGAYFGASFPHLFVMQKPQIVPSLPAIPYHPRIYGFKVYDGRFDVPTMGMSTEGLAKQVNAARKEQVEANGRSSTKLGVPRENTKLFESQDEDNSNSKPKQTSNSPSAGSNAKNTTNKREPSPKNNDEPTTACQPVTWTSKRRKT